MLAVGEHFCKIAPLLKELAPKISAAIFLAAERSEARCFASD
jgi:hypothetical protein